MHDYLSEITAIRHLTLEVVELSVRLLAPDELNYTAGQQVQIKVQGIFYPAYITLPPSENNQLLTLCMQIPADEEAKEVVAHFKVGDQLKLRGPEDTLPELPLHRDLLLVAEDVGVAPFAPIIASLLLNEFDKQIKLVFQVRSEENVFYFERFNALAKKYPQFTFVPMVTHPHAHWPGEVGTAATYVDVADGTVKSWFMAVIGKKPFVTEILAKWAKIGGAKADAAQFEIK